MYQAILMYTDINKSTKIGNICDDSRKLHSDLQVRDLVYSISEAECFELLPGISSWFGQFIHDVI
ncbi:hypothetical protein D3C71_2247010 [compost metagenome]